MTDLFDFTDSKQKVEPLAQRVRPQTLDQFIGQEHIVGPGKLLRRAIEADQLSSLIFYGPPGTGKTTLAMVISKMTKAFFVRLNAVTVGVKEIRQTIDTAKENLKYYQRRTILFLDEIHRFNKSQQDALLPAVEEGTIILIGATTENPYFEVNSPLLSRSRIFTLKELTDQHIEKIMVQALADKERGLGRYQVEFGREALSHLVTTANGDARNALNALELAVMTTIPENGVRHITLEIAAESIQKRILKYDKSGDNHYDVISAFIKSLRGSEPDAALYWFARAIQAGEDPKFLVRRLIVHASEDVGLADSRAMLVAHAAANALEWLGMPEARIPIAQAIIYIASAPKSNSVIKAIEAVFSSVEEKRAEPVPAHLRDSHYKGAKSLGHGNKYKYPHQFQKHWVNQQYLPDNLVGQMFYSPSDQGEEQQIKRYLNDLKED